MARSELGVCRYPAQLFGALEGALAVGVPAVVEFALVLVGPLLGNMVRTVNGAGGPVHEEGLVGLEGLVLAEPLNGVVGEIFGEVVVIVAAGCVGVVDDCSV